MKRGFLSRCVRVLVVTAALTFTGCVDGGGGSSGTPRSYGRSEMRNPNSNNYSYVDPVTLLPYVTAFATLGLAWWWRRRPSSENVSLGA
jgi:hypothetical protein